MPQMSFLFTFLILFAFSFLYASDEIQQKEGNHLTVIQLEHDELWAGGIKEIEGIIEEIDKEQKNITVNVRAVRENRSVVRVGDATNTYSFGNTMVFAYGPNTTNFTYGDKISTVSSLKKGDGVVITMEDDKAVKINGTEQIQGIVEMIDIKSRHLTLKVGNQIKKIPFQFFRSFTIDGKRTPAEDVKVGDSVILNINLGLFRGFIAHEEKGHKTTLDDFCYSKILKRFLLC